MSPKSLLRHKLAVSTLEDLTEGGFQPVIPEQYGVIPKQVTRLVLCSGKIFYDLLENRPEDNPDNIAIIRVEQLYPFPDILFKQELDKYPNLEKIIWCQEEPQNQGAWYQTRHHLIDCIGKDIALKYCGRPASASPAVGSFGVHIEQQKAVVEEALYG
jgi:2-oxoglutarate dehydrogenase E1 component